VRRRKTEVGPSPAFSRVSRHRSFSINALQRCLPPSASITSGKGVIAGNLCLSAWFTRWILPIPSSRETKSIAG
jgi:hypothetical protein